MPQDASDIGTDGCREALLEFHVLTMTQRTIISRLFPKQVTLPRHVEKRSRVNGDTSSSSMLVEMPLEEQQNRRVQQSRLDVESLSQLP